MTDRLALATHVRKARRGSICTICRVPIIIGQPIARLIKPPGWCHVRCIPAVARVIGPHSGIDVCPEPPGGSGGSHARRF